MQAVQEMMRMVLQHDGRSGGFVGYNDEGLLKNNNMYYCDVVRGTSKLVGPFSGKSDLELCI